MSNVKKTVKITENDLVDLIDNIVNEAVAAKKTQWLAEQAKKDANKTQLLERKISALESKFKTLLEGKK
jgi:hypothetical protein